MDQILRDALTAFNEVQTALRDERAQCIADRRFYSLAGAQWEGDLGAQFENKPKFEVNKVHLSVMRIINEYRNNRITVNFTSKDGSADDALADTCDSLYRADEQDSGAEEAYDNAFEEAAAGGFGAWRLRAVYEDDEDAEDERQRIRFEPIFDADTSVFFDLQAKRQDKADAKRCWVLTSMTRAAYKDTYGDDPTSWDKLETGGAFAWATADVVYVAEYYVVEEATHVVQVWRKLDGTEERFTEEEAEENADTLRAIGAQLVRVKKVKRPAVHKYILSGGRVLEDCGIIAGRYIPIIPVYGKRWFIDNVERCMGHVRHAKDAQRLKNMQVSRLGEISALSPTEKPIFVAEQMSGHAKMWSDDNVNNYPYLLVNKIEDAAGQEVAAGPVGYTKPPAIPPAMAALLQITEEDMRDLLGNNQSQEQVAQRSGVAVELIQQRLDMQTYIYMSNMAKAVRRCGEVWLGMARDLYFEEGRKMKGVDAHGKATPVELMRLVMGADASVAYENDLSRAKFDVAVEVGPTSSSRRAATVRALAGMMGVTDDAETRQVLGAMAMMNMEGEGIGDVREYFRRKLVRLGVVKPTDAEREELAAEAQNARPSAEDEYYRAEATKARAQAVESEADTVLKQARADEARAKTLETLSDVRRGQAEAALAAIEQFGPRVEVQQ